MADAFNLTDNTPTVIARLDEIAAQIGNLRPAYAAIGEALAESTKDRFSSSTGPDGERWAPLAPATVLSRLAEISGEYAAYSNLKTGKQGRVRVGDKKGYYRKDGRLASKGVKAVMGMRPLVASGLLQDTITWQADATSAQIGTNRFAGEWDAGAAVHQFGSRDGTIPARPFLGVSAQDEATILDILDTFLRSTIDGQ